MAHDGVDADRRRYERAALENLLEFQAGDRVGLAQIEDISEGGVRLQTDEPLPEAEAVTVWVPLQGRSGRIRTCRIDAKVVRCDDEQIALSFEDLLPRHMLQLRDFVWRRRLPV